jgi:hypothetical protein
MAASLSLEAPVERPRRARARHGIPVPVAVLAVGLAYFVWVAVLGTNALRLNFLEPTVTVLDWVNGGAVLMVALLLLLVVWSRRQRGAEPAAEAGAEAPSAASYSGDLDDELVMTAEQWQGLRVLEYSRPPKSVHAVAVYAKCLVPVDAQYVVRVEDLVAEARD